MFGQGDGGKLSEAKAAEKTYVKEIPNKEKKTQPSTKPETTVSKKTISTEEGKSPTNKSPSDKSPSKSKKKSGKGKGKGKNKETTSNSVKNPPVTDQSESSAVTSDQSRAESGESEVTGNVSSSAVVVSKSDASSDNNLSDHITEITESTGASAHQEMDDSESIITTSNKNESLPDKLKSAIEYTAEDVSQTQISPAVVSEAVSESETGQLGTIQSPSNVVSQSQTSDMVSESQTSDMVSQSQTLDTVSQSLTPDSVSESQPDCGDDSAVTDPVSDSSVAALSQAETGDSGREGALERLAMAGEKVGGTNQHGALCLLCSFR